MDQRARLLFKGPHGTTIVPMTTATLSKKTAVADERVWTWTTSRELFKFWADDEWEVLGFGAFLRDKPYTCDLTEQVDPASWPGRDTHWQAAVVIDDEVYRAEHIGPERRVEVEVRLPDAAAIPGLSVCRKQDQTPVRVQSLRIVAQPVG
jgi:hypothetical protein